MNVIMVEIGFLMMAALLVILLWYLHQTLGELERVYNEIDDLTEECEELDRLATQYKQKAKHYEIIYNETAFAAYTKAIG